MTTPEAARSYEAEHVIGYKGRKPHVYNPLNKPLEALPIIFGFNNGGTIFFDGMLIAEDGTRLGNHACSSEAYMLGDLGILEGYRPDRHDKQFKPHYPDGYKMEFVTHEETPSHKKLTIAIQAHLAMCPG